MLLSIANKTRSRGIMCHCPHKFPFICTTMMSIGQRITFINSVRTEVKKMLESVLRKGVLSRFKDM